MESTHLFGGEFPRYTCDHWLSLSLEARREDSDLCPVLGSKPSAFIHKPKHRESDRLYTRPLNAPVDVTPGAGAAVQYRFSISSSRYAFEVDQSTVNDHYLHTVHVAEEKIKTKWLLATSCGEAC